MAKRKRRMTIQGPDDAEEPRNYVFRVPTLKDIWAVFGKIPELEQAAKKATDKQGTEEGMQAADVMELNLQSCEMADQMLSRLGVSPKLRRGLDIPESIPRGVEYLEDIDPNWRIDACEALMEAAGMNPKQIEEEAANPTTETRAGG